MKKVSYYELNQDARQDQKIVFDLGCTAYPSHFHKKTEITYMLKGDCSSVISQTEYFAEQDEILYVPDYYPHSYSTSDNAKRIVLIPISEYITEADNLTGKKTFPCVLNDKEYNRAKILPVLEEMLAVQENDSINTVAKRMILKGYTGVFYGKIFDRYSNNLVERKKQVEMLTNILVYLEEHYKENITLDDLANKFGYNKFYFSKLFNSCVGDNLKNYVNNIRVKKFTKLYADDSSANVTTLALSLGFDSMPSFYRAFKRVYRCSPKDYFNA